MFNRFISISMLWTCFVLGGIGTAPAQPDARPGAAPAGGFKPVTVSVVESETGERVTRFSYQLRYRAPGVTSPKDDSWHHVESPSGTVVVPVPLSCRLTVAVRWKDARAAPDEYRDFVIRSNDSARRVVVKLERGLTVHGIVRDAKTRKPIAGAKVNTSSIGSFPQAFDDDSQTTSDKDGRFELHGVNPGLGVWAAHPGYIEGENVGTENRGESPFDISLERDDTRMVRGTVRESNGQNFDILAGPGKSFYYARYGLRVEWAFEDRAAGRFALGLDQPGRTWIGVRARGYAIWELFTDVARGGLTQVVRLESGVAVSGKVLATARGLTKIQARLVPRRDSGDGRGLGSDETMTSWAALSTTVAADGILRFDHVRPDAYTLHFSGPGVTPRTLVIDVPAGGLDLGQVRLAGCARLEGRVFPSAKHGGNAWVFADGHVRLNDYETDDDIAIMSDENGRFSVDGVFIGLVKVFFRYTVDDVGFLEEWRVQVVEGQTSEVRLLDPAARRDLPVEFRIGDGSIAQYKSGTGLGAQRKVDEVTSISRLAGAGVTPRGPMFRVELIPRPSRQVSFLDPGWHEPDLNSRVVLSDVSPGTYRLRVIDWLGHYEFDEAVLFEQDITMPSDALPIKVSLGAGCITGQFLEAGQYLEQTEVIAVAHDGKGSVRRARCDNDGNFCVRYLDPGTYTLFAHDAKNGWSRVENVAVASNVTDVGERRLAPGGTIHGVISFKRPSPLPDAVIATGPSKVSLNLPFKSHSSFDQFELTGLWPGTWTIAVRGGGEVLATAKAEISGTETKRVEMAVGSDRQP